MKIADLYETKSHAFQPSPHPALRQAMIDAGYRSVQDFYTRNHFHPTEINRLYTGEQTPFVGTYGWSRLANEVAEVLDCLPEDLFGSHGDLPLEPFGAGDPETPMDALDMNRRRDLLDRFLPELPERLQAIVNAYLDGHTFDEIGQQFGVSRERVRQLYVKAVQWLIGRIGEHLDGRAAGKRALSGRQWPQ